MPQTAAAPAFSDYPGKPRQPWSSRHFQCWSGKSVDSASYYKRPLLSGFPKAAASFRDQKSSWCLCDKPAPPYRLKEKHTLLFQDLICANGPQ